jgi:2-polyprenyl-3-methyl-5-hydroxy-6-metoxy-1,4-benzoquinol methylase
MNKISSIADSLYTKHYKSKQIRQEKVLQAKYLLTKISFLKFQKSENILDVGCGIGMLGNQIKRKFKVNVFGVDSNRQAISEAKKLGVNAKLADIEGRLPYEKAFFDKIFCVQVIEHIVNPDAMLQEIRRVLKKDGMLIITTPNLAVWFNRIIFLFGQQPFFTEVSTRDKTLGLKFTRKFTDTIEPVGHLRVFTHSALKDILEFHGFEIEKSLAGEVNYFPKPMQIIDRMFSFIPGLGTDLIMVARKK